MAIITIPSYRGAGTFSSTGTGTLTIPQPTTVGIDDILIVVAMMSNENFTTWPIAGWENVPNIPTGFGTAGAAGGVKMHLMWKRATATTGNGITTSASPSDDYILGQMFAIQNVARRGDPWEASATANQTTAGTAVTFEDITTLGPQRFIFQALVGDADLATTTMVSAYANANLVSPTERSDNWISSSSGGGMFVGTATRTLAGAIGGSTLTLNTSQVYSKWTGALRPIESHSRSIIF